MTIVDSTSDAAVCLAQKAGLSQGGRVVCVWLNGKSQRFTVRAVDIRPGRTPGNHWTMEIIGEELTSVRRHHLHKAIEALTQWRNNVPILLHEHNPDSKSQFRCRWVLVDQRLTPLGKYVRYNPT